MSNWQLDDGFHLDEASNAEISTSTEFSMDSTLIDYPFSERQLEAGVGFEMDVLSSIGLDLMAMLPEKYHKSQILIDYLDEAGIQIGEWLTKVRDIVMLLNVETISDVNYIKYLGALIGVVFPPQDTASTDEIKRNISQAIDWYKVKGTYKSIQIISMIQRFAVNLYDMYTNNYSDFVLTNWFVGRENENPPGLDSSYYKSPHFALEILLNQVYTSSSGGSGGSSIGGDVLWITSLLDNFYQKVEETRPVHTVPHYMLLLDSKTDELGHIITVDGNIQTKVMGQWQYSTRYFDFINSVDAWNFDDGHYLDESSTAFIQSVTKWVLATGNDNINDSGFDITHPVLTGTIDVDDITISDDKITYEFIVPRTIVQNSIKEVGLYVPGSPDKLVAACTFPSINKDSRIELRVVFEIYRKDLS